MTKSASKYFFAFLIIAVSVSVFAFANGTIDCTGIDTDKGRVTGTLDEKNNICNYRGIPFAAPPLGDLRFARPVEHDPWSETLIADTYSDQCVQGSMGLIGSGDVSGDEDCLYLNVWHQAGVEKGSKPVMVFIYGGGFLYGSGNWPLYDSTRLARRGDVVVVTFNYRLASLGFLMHPALKDSEGFNGNYGLHDQVMALKWVQKNIASFGGDPDNVTIFGESAGGISVGLLYSSPMTKGLFKQAIIESGPAQVFCQKTEKMEKTSLDIAKTVGCGDPATAVECLRALDAKELMEKTPGSIGLTSDFDMTGKFLYSPAVDGRLLPENPLALFEKGEFNTDVALMLGNNTDEAAYFTLKKKFEQPGDYEKTVKNDAAKMSELFELPMDPDEVVNHFPVKNYKDARDAYNSLIRDVAFACPTRQIAKTVSKYQPNTFMYIFGKSPDEKGPMKDWGAFHAAELPFVFGNFEFMGIKFSSKKNNRLSNMMIGYWSSFAHNGVPGMKGLPEWEPFTERKLNYMKLDVEIEPGTGYSKDTCDYIEPILSQMK